jgi:uncharacterized membrane protein YgcG
LSAGAATRPALKNELFKTELCRSYVATAGFCRYGAKCQFAHGAHELRPVRRHPRYKTKHCRNWSTLGACPYGIRCRFIHAVDGAAAAPAAQPPHFHASRDFDGCHDAVPYAYAYADPASAPPPTAPAAVAAAYDRGTHGPLSAFTRELLAELPSPRATRAPRASTPGSAVSAASASAGGADGGSGGSGSGGGGGSGGSSSTRLSVFQSIIDDGGWVPGPPAEGASEADQPSPLRVDDVALLPVAQHGHTD